MIEFILLYKHYIICGFGLLSLVIFIIGAIEFSNKIREKRLKW